MPVAWKNNAQSTEKKQHKTGYARNRLNDRGKTMCEHQTIDYPCFFRRDIHIFVSLYISTHIFLVLIYFSINVQKPPVLFFQFSFSLVLWKTHTKNYCANTVSANGKCKLFQIGTLCVLQTIVNCVKWTIYGFCLFVFFCWFKCVLHPSISLLR